MRSILGVFLQSYQAAIQFRQRMLGVSAEAAIAYADQAGGIQQLRAKLAVDSTNNAPPSNPDQSEPEPDKPPSLVPWKQQAAKLEEIWSSFDDYDTFVISGPPQSGKTQLL